ncbi:contact-dependent growth inhibition system immunity protein [Pantoea eucalypti]|jgi:glycine betaine/choline ABC-type transport system substrate-binding protein|uniref:contact-dependent growth inhibition system immunity protein n=1 Tax=Pantoea TaxID=53335 RepID=UPI00057DC97E|nr:MULTISPECIES: contact-dependent growth inhibition system immunity protein [Pantoea]AWP34846.1 hypothetical protein B9D02_19850 [Pantoea vagans]
MDTDMTKSCEMDNLVVAYYGQDCDIFDPDCDFDNLLNEYLATSNPFNLRMLLANIQDFEQESDGLKVFSDRYRYDFAPDRWDMTATQWLSIVKERVIEHLHANGHSSELSKF